MQKRNLTCYVLALVTLFPRPGMGVDRYVSLTGGHVAPFTSWTDAATNIQDAIDAASAGDVVWVTNGVYATGGKVMAGDLTNRIALDKTVSVLSVNGAAATVIQGQKDVASTNGPTAVRCAWLTNGAVLRGFTLRGGATRSAGDQFDLRSGGGVWASGTNAVIKECTLFDNAASAGGGGAFRGSLSNCIVRANVSQGDGGGVYSNTVYGSRLLENTARLAGGGAFASIIVNSALTANRAGQGGGASSGILRNCTVTFNTASSAGGFHANPPFNAVTNCIIWQNTATSGANYFGGITFRNSCTTPLPSGAGNISSDPLLGPDGMHVSSNSPSLGAGLAIAVGVDLDGHSWNSPPAMGCDQWKPEPAAPQPAITFESWGQARISAASVGQPPFAFHWMLNGSVIENGGAYFGADSPSLLIRPLQPEYAGNYQVVVSNSFGVTTSFVAQLNVRCVDVNCPTPAPPFASWATAAHTIQDAVSASAFGDAVLVTNGIYAEGGKAMPGDMTSRAVLDKPIALMSAAGPTATVIQGAWDAAVTNGPGSVRGVWMNDGAALLGFTVRGGSGGPGGGIWCNSSNARVANCIIRGNAANSAGAVYRGLLYNCFITQNTASSVASATAFSSLVNCTVFNNPAPNVALSCVGGFPSNFVYNSIIWENRTVGGTLINYSGLSITNSCTIPLPPGTGNISANPLLESDGLHLQVGSPCLSTGNSNFSTGFDLDGQPWGSPPSMGCDERLTTLAVGQPQWIAAKGAVRIDAGVIGQSPIAAWWYRNGNLVANDARHTGSDTTQLAITGFDPTDTGLYHVVVSNTFGSVTSTWVQIRARFVDVANPSPVAPFTNWATAAASIQEAVDAADSGELIVVTNGLYAVGGKAVAGDLTNRVTLDKVVTVASVNGPVVTVIAGARDAATNGPAAERCAWVGNWATLSGFTLTGGATRSSGDANTLQSGGGAWGLSPNSCLRDCVISNNAALQAGGGVFGGALFNCIVANNCATNGGGANRANLTQCIVRDNLGFRYGGGVNSCAVANCLIQGNQSLFYGGGAIYSLLDNSAIVENDGFGVSIGVNARNCIIWGNTPANLSDLSLSINYSCTALPIPGTNNIIADPQLVDPFHLTATSPCRDTGSPLYAFGNDLDGEPWQNPPSMGADQVTSAALTGPLLVTIETQPSLLVNRLLPLIGRISGRASRVEWNFGDGPTATNLSYTTMHAWTKPGNYVVTFRAFNDDYPLGVATNVTIEVRPIAAPAWTSIQRLYIWSDIYFGTEVGASNTIEFATNLAAPVNWMALGAVVSTNNTMFFRDTSGTNEARFYRIRAY